ncbi:MAG: recombination protein RecR [Clostridia bacterium]|nr:recombination protein RecR [Clostridia bacterium]
MAYQVVPLQRLIEQFEKLPGIGKKTAQRLAFYVLSMPDTYAKDFAEALTDAKQKIKYCKVCCNLTDGDTCSVCADTTRDRTTICVVEEPQDVAAFERAREYRGLYHILHGTISPLDGIGPEQLRIKELMARLGDPDLKEVIIATNPTVEGEATASYLSRLIKPMGLRVSRLAYGIPVGGDLEYADEVTLMRALEGRNVL